MADAEQTAPEPKKRVAWHCACFNARRAARAITNYYDRALAPSGINATQFTMLGAVSMLGPFTISEMADRLSLDRTTLTRNIKVLEKADLLNVTRGAEDKRERIVTLSTKGEAAVEIATPLWRDAQASVVKGLGEDRWRRLQADLGELHDVAEACLDDGPAPGMGPV